MEAILLSIILIHIIVNALLFYYFSRFKKQKESEIEKYKQDLQESKQSQISQQYNDLVDEFSKQMNDRVHQEKINSQLENARIIQTKLNHVVKFQPEGFSIRSKVFSADECAGDWWYVFWKGDTLFLWVGDVTGHGISAALVASACRSTMMSIHLGPRQNLQDQAEHLNNVIFEMFKGDSLVTFVATAINFETGMGEMINGCHPDPFLISKNGVRTILSDQSNPFLGKNSSTTFNSTSIKVENDETLLVYTDGLTDIKIDASNRNSQRQMQSLLEANKNLAGDSTAMVQFIREQVKTQIPMNGLNDDITFVALSKLEIATQSKNQNHDLRKTS